MRNAIQRQSEMCGSSELTRLAYKQKEAAQVLGVSDRTLRDWMAGDDPPPCFRRGKTLLFPRLGLIAWMAKSDAILDPIEPQEDPAAHEKAVFPSNTTERNTASWAIQDSNL